MVYVSSFHARRWAFIVGRNSTSCTFPTDQTQSPTACKNCNKVCVCHLASFDVQAFTSISLERSSHPTNSRATEILCGPTTGDKTYFGQGMLKLGPWEQGFTLV
ncbi:hypothetical protein AVEN_182189-1 [Araneus ventricosus]|uniref:Uncharacterized protein n=1 Tax=Araneus ventricosus TaxID=182803 RepID=A0A4Y2E2Q8_ARAVE|nr:hypothetical protein AVEN_182189-1 [Araneus ventricosus]